MNDDNEFIADSLLIQDITILSAALSKVDPETFGLLKCTGVCISVSHALHICASRQADVSLKTADTKPPTYELVFDVPPGLRHPRSLRTLLGMHESQFALQDRLVVAKSLARSVMYLHTAKFVHKNIRPGTIVVFQDGKSSVGVPFLVGFERFRAIDGVTARQGNQRWEQNLYRHPQRQGVRPEEDYIMQHDIYSLGVCLLEIGLWTSFVSDRSLSLEAVSENAMPDALLRL